MLHSWNLEFMHTNELNEDGDSVRPLNQQPLPLQWGGLQDGKYSIIKWVKNKLYEPNYKNYEEHEWRLRMFKVWSNSLKETFIMVCNAMGSQFNAMVCHFLKKKKNWLPICFKLQVLIVLIWFTFCGHYIKSLPNTLKFFYCYSLWGSNFFVPRMDNGPLGDKEVEQWAWN